MLPNLTGFLVNSEDAGFTVGTMMLHVEERFFQMVWKSEQQYLGDQEKFPAYN